MTKPVTIEDIIYFLDRQYYGKMGRAYRVTFRKSSQKPEWDFIQVEPQRRESYDYLGISWEDWQRSYVQPIVDDITSALDRKFGKGLKVNVTEKGFIEIMGFNNMSIVPSRNANLKNLTKRVADRHQKVSRIETIEGKWKRVSPIIGTWFESLITKLASLENAMGYAEKIANKEHKRIESLVERKYGYSDNFEDEDYDDPLVQGFLWIDDFWGQVHTSRSSDMNKFQKKIEEAKEALEQTIYNVNSWGWHATRMANQKQAEIYNEFELENTKTRLIKVFSKYRSTRPDWTYIGQNEGWVWHMERPPMEAKKIAKLFEKALQRIVSKDFKITNYYSDDYETDVVLVSKLSGNKKRSEPMKCQLIIDNRVSSNQDSPNSYLKDKMKVLLWEGK